MTGSAHLDGLVDAVKDVRNLRPEQKQNRDNDHGDQEDDQGVLHEPLT